MVGGSELQPTSSSNPERILVVGREELTCRMISAILESAGYPYQVAQSGEEAWAVLESGPSIQLLLSTLMMGEMEEIGLLERIDQRFPDMPFVMLTAIHDAAVAAAVIRHGAYDLTESFENEQLLTIVRRALDNRRLKLENPAYQTNLESLVGGRTDQLRQAMSDLERSYDISLELAGDLLELKDAESQAHAKRTTAFSIALARAVGLQQNSIQVIARGAVLHDIGKIAVPDAILRKPGALTADEWEIMKEHPYTGYQVLCRVPFLQEAAEIVHAHHERFDGTGHPRGLKGEEIPLGARIVAIAETLDAITSNYPYRAAQSIRASQEEIKNWSGRQFDPEIVDIFLRMPEGVWHDLRKEIDSQSTGSRMLPRID